MELPQMPLGHEGRWITDNVGRVVIVHGVNMINKLPPYTLSATGFGEADAQLLAGHGINAVRVGVIYSAVEPAPGTYDDNYLQNIKGTVDTLASHGIMSLIDFHQDGWGPAFICEGFPEWATLTPRNRIRPVEPFPVLYGKNAAVNEAWGNFWFNTLGPEGVGPNGVELLGIPLQDSFARAWAYAAAILKDSQGILGWELLNEPWPGDAFNSATEVLTNFTQKVVDAIRTVDSDHMIWYEPWVTFDAGQPTEIGKINDSAGRLGMAFHNYKNIDNLTEYDGVWDNAVAHSRSTATTDPPYLGDALLCTEFGACLRPDQADVITAELDSADGWMIPAIYWAYWNRTPYQIEADGTLVPAAAMGIVWDPSRPLEDPGNVWPEGLDALTRPYPMFIAGRPDEWQTGTIGTKLTFILSYHRTPESGWDQYTQIFVPSRTFGTNPSVNVPNGRWVNPGAGTQFVLIENNADATMVTVTITQG